MQVFLHHRNSSLLLVVMAFIHFVGGQMKKIVKIFLPLFLVKVIKKAMGHFLSQPSISCTNIGIEVALIADGRIDHPALGVVRRRVRRRADDVAAIIINQDSFAVSCKTAHVIGRFGLAGTFQPDSVLGQWYAGDNMITLQGWEIIFQVWLILSSI